MAAVKFCKKSLQNKFVLHKRKVLVDFDVIPIYIYTGDR